MSDFETAKIKAQSKEQVYSSLTNNNTLLSVKIKQDGIEYSPKIALSEEEAEEILEGASKYSEAIAVQVVLDSSRTQSFIKKLNDLRNAAAELVGNKGKDHYDASKHSWSSEYYAGSVFQDVINRTLKEKSSTKSCRICGHSHATSPKNSNLSIKGCNKCSSQFFLFTEADKKKHANALIKLKKLEDKEAGLECKIKTFAEKAVGRNQYFWYIGGATKAISEYHYYDD